MSRLWGIGGDAIQDRSATESGHGGDLRLFERLALQESASQIVKLVSETVRGWDAQTVTNRLEAAVGRDLQYIRINGTIVGGMVGLVLHVVDAL